jgi:hypothetical protein
MPVNPATHPSIETLQALSLGKLDDAEAAALLSHLESCPDCCRKAAAAAGDSFLDRLRDAQVSFGDFAPAGTPSQLAPTLEAADMPTGELDAAGSTAPWSGRSAVRFPQGFPAPFGRYQVLELLGQGGMGSVYLAHDSQLDRSVALKIPHIDASEGPQMRERFYREARAAATLQHPNICPLHDVGEIDGAPYLTMAYVEGQRLSEFAAARPLTPRQSALLVRKLALALEEAHKRGVIHRDLKPENIMIDRRGEPIIMDFGLARRTRGRDPRLTQRGSALGTPAYMPPEQVSGDVEATGPASDVYSLGVIFYELLAGRLPFRGDPMAMLSQVLMSEPPPPSAVRAGIDPELEAICLKAMAKKPQERFASMAELAAALTTALRASSPAAPAAAPAAPEPAARRGIPVWMWLVGAGMGLVLLVGILWAAGVIKVKTRLGTIVLENVPADADVQVEGRTITLTRNGEEVTVTLLPEGPQRLRVVQGGREIWSSDVTVKLDGDPVRLRVEPRRPPLKEEIAPRQKSSFFDAADLAASWEGLPGYWHTEDGALVGRCPEGRPAHTFLVSKKVYRDFDLKFQVRRKDGIGNSGVQFRSELKDRNRFRVIGPQCEIDSTTFDFPPGSLVTEPSAKPLAEKSRPEVAQKYEDAGFNDYHIRCVGKHVTITVNGITAVDGDFPSLPDEGVIAWQIHGKRTPREVTFRNIEFTDLGDSHAGDGFVPLFNGEDLDGWSAEGGADDQWSVQDQTIVGRSSSYRTRSYLLTKKKYRDFVLRLELNVAEGSHGAVAIRAIEGERLHEKSVFDHPLIKLTNPTMNDREPTGTTFFLKSAAEYVHPDTVLSLPTDTWHVMEVRVQGDHCVATVNGKEVIDTKLDPEAENKPGLVPGLQRSKGKIGLQANTGTMRYRKIEIKELSAKPAGGFVPLFNGKDLAGWEKVGKGDWEAQDGVLRTRGDEKPGWLATRREYGDFELALEYRLGPGANSGVFLRAWKDGDPRGSQFLEIQLIDDRGNNTVGKTTGTAAIYAVVAPNPTVESTPGAWHKLEIRARGRRLQVSFEGQKVIDANLDDYPKSFGRFPGLTQTSGRIGLQNYGTSVEFRNVRIKELSE